MFFFTLIIIVSFSCGAQEKELNIKKSIDPLIALSNSQIGEYVTSAYEDSKGNLWFGTLAKGIAKYDGKKLRYYTTNDGLPTDRVTGILEGSDGIFWLTTGAGLCKYDGKEFTNYSINDDFFTNTISTIYIDSEGVFWVGTWGGVFQFDGEKFTPFPLPYPKVETTINKDTKDWITDIIEDSEGTIWISRDGYGICRYDGQSFSYILKKDGLHSNSVTEMELDSEGGIWIGTRVAEKDNPDVALRFGKGGINKWQKNEIISFPDIAGFNNSDVHAIYKDLSGHIWIGTIKNGVYKYDGKAFNNYDIPISVMGILNDQNGNYWLSGAGGLYKINTKDTIQYIRTTGPWQ
ncbi:MAG: two-component regulator propeller domain-containing protein [Saprospiraceae bacterium]|nr:two-component regulator propeller domain-containing protein [Saprospiraceae bacterium]